MATNKKAVKIAKSGGSMRLSEAAVKKWKDTVDNSKGSQRSDSERKVVFS